MAGLFFGVVGVTVKFASLGSGSQGNASLISAGNTVLLIDCGFSLRTLVQRLQTLNLHPSQLAAVLVTHEHADHIRGVGPLSRKYQLPVYLTQGTAQSKALGELPKRCIIAAGEVLIIDDIQIEINSVPHDAREPVQFIFNALNKRLGLLTDTGSIPDALADKYKQLDALILEANYCPEMLARGPYPPSLKERVGGAWGHLSNHQCVDLVEQLDLKQLQHLVLAHISQKNNSAERVQAALAHLPQVHSRLHLANQEEGFTWLHIA